MMGVRDIPVAELKHNVVALAKAIKVFGSADYCNCYFTRDVGAYHP